jgi:dihydrodipicolinate reductase
VIRVGVIGALGKMGRMVCAAVQDDPDLTLVSAIDRSHIGEPIGPIIGVPDLGVKVSDEMDKLLQAEVEAGRSAAVRWPAPRCLPRGSGCARRGSPASGRRE